MSTTIIISNGTQPNTDDNPHGMKWRTVTEVREKLVPMYTAFQDAGFGVSINYPAGRSKGTAGEGGGHRFADWVHNAHIVNAIVSNEYDAQPDELFVPFVDAPEHCDAWLTILLSLLEKEIGIVVDWVTADKVSEGAHYETARRALIKMSGEYRHLMTAEALPQMDNPNHGWIVETFSSAFAESGYLSTLLHRRSAGKPSHPYPQFALCNRVCIQGDVVDHQVAQSIIDDAGWTQDIWYHDKERMTKLGLWDIVEQYR